MTTYSPAVERWRPLVEKYFPPELVDKALYVIDGESKGNPGAVGDGGAARGLFQIQDSTNFPNRPNAAYLDNPENNIKYAAQQLGAAKGKWTDWGEGATYKGKPFGALGNNPYGGGSAPTGVSSVTTPTDPNADAYRTSLYKQEQDYSAKLQGLLATPRPTDFAGGAAYDDQISQYGELLAKVRTAIAQLKQAPDSGQQQFNNSIAQGNLDINQGNLDLSIAQQAINRQLSGEAEAGRRASLMKDAADTLIKYGMPEGKTSFSDDELGGAFSAFGKVLGRDPSQQNKMALGQVAIDPVGDLARFDAQLGVTGPIPGAYTPAPRPTGTTSAPSPTAGYSGEAGSPNGAFVDPATGMPAVSNGATSGVASSPYGQDNTYMIPSPYRRYPTGPDTTWTGPSPSNTYQNPGPYGRYPVGPATDWTGPGVDDVFRVPGPYDRAPSPMGGSMWTGPAPSEVTRNQSNQMQGAALPPWEPNYNSVADVLRRLRGAF